MCEDECMDIIKEEENVGTFLVGNSHISLSCTSALSHLNHLFPSTNVCFHIHYFILRERSIIHKVILFGERGCNFQYALDFGKITTCTCLYRLLSGTILPKVKFRFLILNIERS